MNIACSKQRFLNHCSYLLSYVKRCSGKFQQWQHSWKCWLNVCRTEMGSQTAYTVQKSPWFYYFLNINFVLDIFFYDFQTLVFQQKWNVTDKWLYVSKETYEVLQGWCVFVGKPGSSPSLTWQKWIFSIGFWIIGENKILWQTKIYDSYMFCSSR